MSTLETKYQLNDSLIATRDKLSVTLAVLSNSIAVEERYHGAVAVWSTQFYTVSECAEAASYGGLKSLCSAIATKLESLHSASISSVEQYCTQLTNWIGTALNYLNDEAFDDFESLLEVVPENTRAQLQGLFNTQSESTSTSSTDDAFIADVEQEINVDSVEEIVVSDVENIIPQEADSELGSDSISDPDYFEPENFDTNTVLNLMPPSEGVVEENLVKGNDDLFSEYGGPEESTTDDGHDNSEFPLDSSTSTLETENDRTEAVYSQLELVTNCSIENITETMNEISESAAAINYSELSEICDSGIEDIEMAAEMTNFSAISKLASSARTYLQIASNQESETADIQAARYLEWLNNLIAYFQRPSDKSFIDDIIVVVPDSERDSLLADMSAEIAPGESTQASEPFPEEVENKIHQFPVENDSEAESDSDAWFDNTIDNSEEYVDDFSVDESQSMVEQDDSWGEDNNDEQVLDASSILGVLSVEISELSEELGELLTPFTTPEGSTENAQEAALEYISLIDRISQISDELGMSGLQQICEFINHNVSLMLTIDQQARQEYHAIFESWPDKILTYLSAPEDEDLCLELISFLQDKWPEPLGDTDAHSLLKNLSSKITMPVAFDNTPEREKIATDEDVALELSDDINQELLEAFFHESPGIAAEFSDCIANVASGVDISDNIIKAQRLAHTLKGSANLSGIKGVANLTHHTEDILEYLSTASIQVPSGLILALQESGDCVETMIDALQGKDSAPDRARQILQDVLDWANIIDSGEIAETTEITSVNSSSDNPVSQAPDLAKNKAAVKSDDAKTDAAKTKKETLHVSSDIVDDMFKMVGEMSIMTSQIQEFLKNLHSQTTEMQQQDRTVQLNRVELEDMVNIRRFSTAQRLSNPSGDTTDFDSLEMDQYDELHSSIHGYVESVSDSSEMSKSIHFQVNDLEGMFVRQQRLTKELQQVVMNARMVPVNTIASRLQRTVRQAARATGKQVELVIEGEDLLLDSEKLNVLTDPLMHMLRNAVDHSIEKVNEREIANKPQTGKVLISFQRKGNYIVVDCTDDGAGLDYEKIRKIGIEKGLIDSSEHIDKASLARLIVTPSFSTSDSITQISGRGVGMDIVNSTIQSQGGSLEIGDNDPCGCSVHLQLPISMVTSHCLLVISNNELIAIPSSTLIRVVPPGTGEFSNLGGKFVFQDGKEVLSSKSLCSLIGSGSDSTYDFNAARTVLLVRTNAEPVAVVADQVTSSKNLVIKGTGKYVKPIQGISGVSILGDGSVVPVLDLADLLSNKQENNFIPSMAENIVEHSADIPNILIVDDSMSVRKSLTQLALDAGYRVSVARDGVEAMAAIKKEKPNLILSDLEMPRMTGLELTYNVRADDNYKHLPIVMISSRSSEKHRQQAKKAGVDRYLSKPFSEDDLLDIMQSMLVA